MGRSLASFSPLLKLVFCPRGHVFRAREVCVKVARLSRKPRARWLLGDGGGGGLTDGVEEKDPPCRRRRRREGSVQDVVGQGCGMRTER